MTRACVAWIVCWCVGVSIWERGRSERARDFERFEIRCMYMDMNMYARFGSIRCRWRGAGGDVTEGVIPMVIQAPTASLNVFAKDIFGKRERKKG